MARPSKLTPEREKLILDAIRAGNDVVVAAQLAGIAQSTFYEWQRRGRTGEQPYARFGERLEQALAHAEAYAVSIVRRSMVGDARHAQWWLERKHPERWGRRQPPPPDPFAAGPVTVEVVWPEQAEQELERQRPERGGR